MTHSCSTHSRHCHSDGTPSLPYASLPHAFMQRIQTAGIDGSWYLLANSFATLCSTPMKLKCDKENESFSTSEWFHVICCVSLPLNQWSNTNLFSKKIYIHDISLTPCTMVWCRDINIFFHNSKVTIVTYITAKICFCVKRNLIKIHV